MTDFVQAARGTIDRVISGIPLGGAGWTTTGKQASPTIAIPPMSKDGFSVTFVLETYGIYPSAKTWHGAPWDAGVWSGPRLVASIETFLRSVLSDEENLTVYYADERPCKSIPHYLFEREWVENLMHQARSYFLSVKLLMRPWLS